jgi:DNA-binding IclR family transcriptional regulator
MPPSRLPKLSKAPRVNAVVQAIAILRLLGSRGIGMGVNAIARGTEISPSSCFNLLKTLQEEGFVTFDPRSKLYALGPGILDLARDTLVEDPLVRAALQPMRTLAVGHEGTAGLWRIEGDRRLVLCALQESEAVLRIRMRAGQRLPLAAGAVGRIAMRRFDPVRSEVQVRLKLGEVRWNRPPSVQEYVSQMVEAGRTGVAVDADQLFAGVTTLAAGVGGGRTPVRFILSLSVFSGRHTPEALLEIALEVRKAAHALGT